MADLRIVDAPVLLQESITDDVKMPTGGLGNYAIRLGDLVWYVVAKENLASKSYVDTSSKGVQDKLGIHIADETNPHKVTKEQVGLGNVDNTADIDKPVSNAVSSAIITATTDMATKAYVNQKDNLKADKATTLSGYGITDAYTKNETYNRDEVDGKDGDLTTLKTADKTNLVKAINEVYDTTKGVVALYDKNVVAGAGANGWTDQLITLSNGRTQKQKNAELVTPFDFGAIGDGVYHKLSEKYTTLADAKKKYPTAQSLDDSIDLCALESFFSHCKSDSGFNADCSIKAWVNRPLILVGNSPSCEFKTNVINGDLTLINNQNDYDITHFMQINAVGIDFTGKLTFIGNDINLPKDRKQHGGLVLGDGGDDGSAGRITINSVAASGFRDFGTALINGCIFPSIRTQHYRDIGAIGMGGEDNKNKHSANITRVSDVKSVDYEQRTTLSVDSLPPLPDFDYHVYQTMCKFDGDDGIYIITDVDKTAKTITVYPCLNFAKTYTKVNYIYGIGMSWSGNNSGCGTFGRLQSILCGVGFWGASLFGGTINYLSTEFCGVGFTLGFRKSVAIGYEISNSYFEGNVFDYVQQWANAKQYPLLNLNNSQGINLDKIAELFSYRIEFYYASEGGYRGQDNFRKNKIFAQNRSYEQKDAITDTLDLGLPDDVVFVKNNGSDIILVIGSGSKLGFNKKTVVIVGDGVNNSPQSNVRITAPNGYALNGGSEVILNTNKSAITATVTYDVLSRAITLSSDALYAKAGASTQRPNNAPTGFVYIDTTLNKPIYKTNSGWVDATGATV